MIKDIFSENISNLKLEKKRDIHLKVVIYLLLRTNSRKSIKFHQLQLHVHHVSNFIFMEE